MNYGFETRVGFLLCFFIEMTILLQARLAHTNIRVSKYESHLYISVLLLVAQILTAYVVADYQLKYSIGDRRIQHAYYENLLEHTHTH